MISTQKTSYGFYVVLEGNLTESDMDSFRALMKTELGGKTAAFSTILDIRQLVPPRSGCLEILRECSEIAFAAGMERIAIIYNSPVVRDQIKQTAHLSKQGMRGRYIDAARFDDPMQSALEYVENGVEPPSTTQKIKVTSGS